MAEETPDQQDQPTIPESNRTQELPWLAPIYKIADYITKGRRYKTPEGDEGYMIPLENTLSDVSRSYDKVAAYTGYDEQITLKAIATAVNLFDHVSMPTSSKGKHEFKLVVVPVESGDKEAVNLTWPNQLPQK